MRKSAVVAAAVAVVVLGLAMLAALLPRVVSLDALKPRIAAALEEMTGRKVAFSRLTLSLFPAPGVRVSDLSFAGDPGHPDEILLSVPEAELRVAILPLLAGRTELSTFLLRRPRILFRKYRDGTHSATEIAARLAKKTASPPAAPGTPTGSGTAVILKSVRIEEANLSVRIEGDGGTETRWDVAPFTIRLAGIGTDRNAFELALSVAGALRGEISFAGTAVHQKGRVTDPTVFDLAGEGKLFGQAVSVAGKMSAPAGIVEFDLIATMPKIRMDAVPGIFANPPEALVGARPEGMGRLTAKVVGNVQSAGYEVDVDLTRSGWTLAPDIRKYIDAPMTLAVQGHVFPDLLVVSNAELSAVPVLLIANTTYVPSTGAREWRAAARVASLSQFARVRGAGLERWSPGGRVTVTGGGRREAARGKETWTMAADLGAVSFRIPERDIEVRDLNGHIEATPEAIDFLPLGGLFNGQRFFLRGNVALGSKPTGQVEFRMTYLDLDALLPSRPETRGAVKKEEERGGARGGGEKGRAVSANVVVAVDVGRARGVEFRDLAGTVRYEKGSITLENLKARIYGGEAAVSGRLDLFADPTDFKVRVAMKDVDAGGILKAKTSLGGLVSGPVTLNGEIGGRTKDFAEFARTATGAGTVRIAGGNIRSVDMFRTAVRLAGLSSFLPGIPATGPYGAVPGETPFRELSADFRVGGGMIRAGALRLASEKLGIEGSADIGFDRTLDFRGVVRLPKEMSDRVRGTAGRFLVGPGGRVEIPVVMSGPVTSPAVAIDTSALGRGVMGEAMREISERAGAPAAGEPAGPETGKKESPAPARERIRKGIEGLLEGLFPKR